jgi:hypothetical protein
MLKSRLVLAAVFVAIGCADVDNDAGPEPATFRITLNAGPCFGTCPVFEVSVDESGHVAYQGEEFVAEKGPFTRDVPSADAHAVYDALRRVHFWDLRDRYATEEDGCPGVSTDAQTLVWTAVVDGRTKRVEHYLGCRPLPAVEALDVLDKVVVAKTNIREWLGPTAILVGDHGK